MTPDRRRRRLLTAVAAVTFASTTVVARPKPRVIHVVAKKFSYVPSEIQVRRGEAVILALTAPEVPMGFNLPDFGLRADIVPGQTTSLPLAADKTGSFTFVCDVFCGSGHEDMSGTLIVVE